MLGRTYLARIDGLLAQNRLLGIALVVMLLFNLTNWFALFHAKSLNQVVVVPVGGEGMQIGNGRADERYLRRMARYIVNQVGSYTAGTARLQMQEVLELFAPERVGEAQVYFERLAQDIERYPSISSAVRWSGQAPLKVDDGLLQVRVSKDRLVNGAISETKTVFYCLRYRIDDARFWLINIQEKEGTGEDLCRAARAPADK